MSGQGPRKKLLTRRSAIFRELTQMSYRGWDQFKAIDYQPLEAELERIKDRLALIEEADEALRETRRLGKEFLK